MRYRANSRGFVMAVFLISALASAGVHADCGFDAVLMGFVEEPVFKDEPCFVGWADSVASYNPGAGVEPEWMNTDNALGQAVGDSFDVVSLGTGGSITLEFDTPIADGPGADFAVFENGFSATFLELAYVEVSSDGQTYLRYPALSATPAPVGAFGTLNPAHLTNFASKYQQGYGTPFDLGIWDIPELQGVINLGAVRFVRLVDVIGDGSELDAIGRPIYDPFPTALSAGFDLDAVGVIHQGTAPPPTSVSSGPVELPLFGVFGQTTTILFALLGALQVKRQQYKN